MKKRATKNKVKECAIDMCCKHPRCGGAIYGLGFIGSAIHYISISTGFWNGALGILKALVWPAYLVYELFKLLYLLGV